MSQPEGEELQGLVPPSRILSGMDVTGLTATEQLEAGDHRGIQEACSSSDSRNRYPFASFIYRGIRDGDRTVKPALRRFAGQVVVDLGAGDEGWGRQIAEHAGARAYVAVEPNFAPRLYRRLADRELMARRALPGSRSVPAAVVAEDMLRFLERLPDASVSIWASGIDSHIIPKEEARRVGEEIERVLDPGGAFLCTAGCVLPQYWKSRRHLLNPDRRTYPTARTGEVNTYRTLYEYSKAARPASGGARLGSW